MRNHFALALDDISRSDAIDLVIKVKDLVGILKIHRLLDRCGPSVAKELRECSDGLPIWIDGKFGDIPRTVAGRISDLMESSGANIFTVHASGGTKMMEAAVNTGATIYAISVLTSMGEKEASEMYNGRTIAQQVMHFAKLAAQSGVKNLVCSALEIGMLKADPETKYLNLIVPATRLPGGDLQDQERSATQLEAFQDGAWQLVLGSEVIGAPDPVAKLYEIAESVQPAFAVVGGTSQ